MTIQELEQCILLYGKDIYSFCMHLAKEKESADDLYQDTFLEATKKIASIRYEDNLSVIHRDTSMEKSRAQTGMAQPYRSTSGRGSHGREYGCFRK